MAFNAPKVSVIIPNFNHGAYLPLRINSILSQTYQDFEIIILDDHSTDKSKEIIESYRENTKITKIIYNESNSGSTFKQWDKGIRASSGEYIWIAESDDWCDSNMLQVLVEGIEKDEDCVISYCQSYCVEGDNKLRFTSQHEFLSEMVNGSDYVEKYLTSWVAIFNASMAIWRRSSYERVSREYLSFRLCGDWRFWIEIALTGSVHISGRILNYFRKHNQDVSGRVYKSGLNYLEELRVLESLLKRKLVTRRKYFKIMKQVFKRYYAERSIFSYEAKTSIEKEFNGIRCESVNEWTYLKFSKYRYLIKNRIFKK